MLKMLFTMWAYVKLPNYNVLMCFYISVIIYPEWLGYTLQIAGRLITSAPMDNNTSHSTKSSHDHTINYVATPVHVSVIDYF